MATAYCQFLSTPSARRATPSQPHARSTRGISIHALREEGDLMVQRPACALANFYPRPPRGGRRSDLLHQDQPEPFLSTPSARRATVFFLQLTLFQVISIHALREEGDCPQRASPPQPFDFYPRPPRGGRRIQRRPDKRHGRFLSTPSARRATAKTETKSLFSNKLYNILHEFRRALIYNGSKSYPNHAK